MKKWKKAFIWSVIGAFLYLGTGYQFAKTNWELYHSTKSFKDLQENREGPKILLFKAFWPLTALVNPDNDNRGPKPPVALASKNSYLVETTLLWGFKIILNVLINLLLVFIDTMVLLTTAFYSLLKFLFIFFTAPFSS